MLIVDCFSEVTEPGKLSARDGNCFAPSFHGGLDVAECVLVGSKALIKILLARLARYIHVCLANKS